MGKVALPTEKAKLLQKRTPKMFIESRPGPYGKPLLYVETGYIIAQLNKIFGHIWTFEVVRENQAEDQVWVLGRLKVMLAPDLVLCKEQYGSADIKRNKNGKPVSIGDDMKAASSDALKKCSSLLGLCADVYFPKLYAKVDAIRTIQHAQNGPETPLEATQPSSVGVTTPDKKTPLKTPLNEEEEIVLKISEFSDEEELIRYDKKIKDRTAKIEKALENQYKIISDSEK